MLKYKNHEKNYYFDLKPNYAFPKKKVIYIITRTAYEANKSCMIHSYVDLNILNDNKHCKMHGYHRSLSLTLQHSIVMFRDWSLITGRGGATKREGGAREVLPLQKGGAEKVLATLKGGHKKFWGSFYAVA